MLDRSLLSLPRERLCVFVAVIALVLFRSTMLVFVPYLAFDSDQAVFGLMAKHIVEGRAFPLFMYGQNYILAVEAWMAAPMFLLFGVSAAALKLPLLAINIAIGLLLITLFERELGLRPALALVPTLFFVLAPPATASNLLEASGGNVEPFLYVLLLWLTRRRPLWFGLIFGIAFLHREFTIYGVIALFLVEWATGESRQQGYWKDRFRALRVTAEVWLAVQFARNLVAAAGPGTTSRNVAAAGNNLLEIWNRFCFDPRRLIAGVGRLFTFHWPRLFGLERLSLVSYGLESRVFEGLRGSGVVLATLVLLAVALVVRRLWMDPASLRRHRFAAYLTLIGLTSAGVFVLGRCGFVDVMRYDLLSILGLVGLTAWALAANRSSWMTRAIVALVVAWAAVSAVAHGALWAEQITRPPAVAKRAIIRGLEARGIQYATSDYWIAYYVTFMTGERIVVESSDFPRILQYETMVGDHRAESVRISRKPCGTAPVFEGVYFCPP